MFQFDSLTPPARFGADALASQDSDRAVPARRALLSWQEHCVECAAPACYASCDLFDPTPLGKCRRFEGGLRRVAGAGDRLAAVHFRKWGKLEAKGNALGVPQQQLARTESRLGTAGQWLDRIGAGLLRLTGERRLANLSERLHAVLYRRARKAAAQGADLPDAFIAEIFNPGRVPVSLILSMVVDQTALARPVAMADQPRAFRQAISVPPGHTAHHIPAEHFAPILSSGLPFLVQISLEGEQEAELVFGQLDFVWPKLAGDEGGTGEATTAVPGEQSTAPRPPAKCVVFDLDNTLWDGVLLEGDVAVRPQVAELFRQLDERGILISIASKNAHEDAMAQLAQAGLADYVLHPQIGWDPKSLGLERIAASLDIGIDSFLFVDDNPFERAQVQGALPMVEVLPDTALASLADHKRLQGAVTPESKRRRAMYQEAAAREDVAGSFDDYRAFLADCAIVLTIRPDMPEDFERIAELVQRTNQLNFSGTKYDRAAIAQILQDPQRHRFVVEARDRFGSYGTVGFCLASREGDCVLVEDFMLSCRVQGKYVEQALFAFLAEHFPGDYPTRLSVNFVPTPRNAAARKVLDTLGFAQSSGGGFARAIARGDLDVDFMSVN